MAYEKKTWTNAGDPKAIPVNAVNLNHIEDGIEGATAAALEVLALARQAKATADAAATVEFVKSYVAAAIAAALGNVAPSPPPVPVLTASLNTGNVPVLRWTESVGATSYTLSRGTSVIYTGAGTAFTDVNVPAGTYTYTVQASSSTGTSAASTPQTVTVSPQTATPVNLIVSSVAMTPANPSTGQEVSFSATVTNTGGTATPAGTIVGIAFLVDNQVVNWSDDISSSLAAGASRVQTANGGPSNKATWTASNGSHVRLAIVDDVNRITESNENDNSGPSTSFTVATDASVVTTVSAVAGSFNTSTRKATVTWASPRTGTVTVARSDSTGATGSTTVDASLGTYTFTTAIADTATSVTITVTAGGSTGSATIAVPAAGTSTPVDTSNPQTSISAGTAGTVRVAYFGASDPGGGFNDSGAKRMPHSANSAYIHSDGRVFLGTYWEEHAQELGGLNADGSAMDAFNNAHTYRGGYAVTSNGTDVWMGQSNGIRRYNINSKSPVSFGNGTGEGNSVLVTGGNDALDKVRGAAIIGSELFVAANNSTMYVYSLSSFSLTRQWSLPGVPKWNGAVAAGGRIAVLTGTTVTWYSATGAAAGTITGLTDPQGLAVDDQNTSRVGVCQGAGDHRVLFFDYSSSTVTASNAVKTLGLPGGYMAATKGDMRNKQRFVFPRFARILSDGSYVVAMYASYPQPEQEGGGAIVRKFNSSGGLVWENIAMTFCDTGFIDSDGVGYTVRDKFLVDHGTNTTTQGKGWSLAAHTLDPTISGDPRIADAHSATSPIVRTVGGKKFMASVGMYADAGTRYYRLDGESWVYGGVLGGGGWGQWIAKNGDYYQAKGDRVEKRPFNGFGTDGFPAWGATQTWLKSSTSNNWSDLRRAQYDSDADVMYVSGFTAARPQPNSNDMEKLAGSTLRRYNNWSTQGFSQQAWSVDLPTSIGNTDVSLIRRIYMPIGLWAEGDFIFTGDMAYGLIRVYRKSTGALVQTWNPAGVDPGAAQPALDAASNPLRFRLDRDAGMPGVGVLDIPNSVTATKLADGRYVVCVEDNGSPKIITYYWTPVSA